MIRHLLFLSTCFCFFSSCSTAAIPEGPAAPAINPPGPTFLASIPTAEEKNPSQTPTYTQTPTDTRANTPTQTPTATKYPGMQATGPFLVLPSMFANKAYLTYIDSKGSINWTINLPQWESSYGAWGAERISPDWNWYAYVTGSVNEDGDYPDGGVVLHLLNLLTGEVQDIASLVPQDYRARQERRIRQVGDLPFGKTVDDCLRFSIGILNNGFYSLAWSPDGRHLAFGAMIDGNSSDVYVFDLDTGRIRRREFGQGNVQRINWSPDGEWILFEQIPFEQIPYYIIGLQKDWESRETMWAVRGNGAGAVKIPGPIGGVDWFSDFEYLAFRYWNWDWWDLTAVNIQTGYAYTCFHESFSYYHVDPISRLMAVVGAKDNKWQLFFGSVYKILDSKMDFTGRTHEIPQVSVLLRGGLAFPFIVWDGKQNYGVTPYGDIVPLGDYILGEISPIYWMAVRNEQEIRVYNPTDVLRYKLVNITKLYVYGWDTNSQGLFLLAEIEGVDAVYYWRLGDPAPQFITGTLPAEKGNKGLFIAPIMTLRTLPNIRILPTRAANPAEGASLWSRTQYMELFQPGTYRYEVTIPANSSWRWSFSLGTTDSNQFEKILLPGDVEFRINGEWIDPNMFRMSDKTAEGRFSRAWASMLYGWRSGDRAELEIRYTLRESVRDGNVEYPAGEYRQIISVSVE